MNYYFSFNSVRSYISIKLTGHYFAKKQKNAHNLPNCIYDKKKKLSNSTLNIISTVKFKV